MTSSGTPWSEAEDKALLCLQAQSILWRQISAAMPHRSVSACAARFRYLKDLEARGETPRRVIPRPEPLPRATRWRDLDLPLPWDDDDAAVVGCAAHHEALMRFYHNRQQSEAA